MAIHHALPLSGGGLNFKIVGGTTQPTNPNENTIWINTSTAIGEWQFSPVEPILRIDSSALQSGDIWIQTVDASHISFSVSKKNNFNVCIMGCKQYIGGVWTDVTTLVYQGGVWVNTGTWYLSPYHNLITGTWKETHTQGGTATFTVKDNKLIYTGTNTVYKGITYQTGIDVTNYNTMYFLIDYNGIYDPDYPDSNDGRATYSATLGLRDATNSTSAYLHGNCGHADLTRRVTGMQKIDISNVTGNAYLFFGLYYATGGLKISHIWFV